MEAVRRRNRTEGQWTVIEYLSKCQLLSYTQFFFQQQNDALVYYAYNTQLSTAA